MLIMVLLQNTYITMHCEGSDRGYIEHARIFQKFCNNRFRLHIIGTPVEDSLKITVKNI